VNVRGLSTQKIWACTVLFSASAGSAAFASTAPGWFEGLSTVPPPPPSTWVLPGEGVLTAATCNSGQTAAATASEVPHSGPVDAMDLREAIERALCQQPALHAAWAQIQIAQAQVGVAHAAYFPELAVGASASEESTQRIFDGRVRSTDAFDQTRFATLSWRLLDSGSRVAHNAAAQAGLAAALNSQDAAVQKVLLAVTAAYFDVQIAQARRDAAAQTEVLAQQAEATVVRRSAHGAAAQADVLQAVVSRARAALRARRAAGGLARAQVQLQQTLGADGDRLPPVLQLSEAAEPVPIDGAAAWASLAQFHPALRAAQAQLRGAEAKRRAVRAEGLPTLDLRNARQLQARSESGSVAKSDTTSLTLTLRIPVFDGFAGRHRLRGAAAQVALRQAERDAIALDIRRQIHVASTDAASSLQAWHAAHAWALAAESANQSAKRRFDAGAADVLEWLGAQAALADAREERFKAIAAWHAAHLALLSSAGVLNRSALALTQPDPAVD